ncbi:type VI secretion system tip protein VgrG [Salmonella enterica subsp. enterica]|nr:type VI secretion system tip protein VgrG [Salmonella enterica subsp. enterica serovar Mikawasima]EJQ8143243.1 type VI secretion system tip protein VgrG [Salmonella enterica]MIO70028.1 type VI secretion system tip protein VgrG [Salmonella enterica subsp. enterica serovar Mikawasima]
MRLIDELLRNQQGHFLSWKGNIASDLLLVALQGNESMSTPFKYKCRSLTNLQETQLIAWHGESVTCRIGTDEQKVPYKYIHGVITGIEYVQRDHTAAECIITIEPTLSLLKLGRSIRVWQNLSVPELVMNILQEYGINDLQMHLHKDYIKREYCIQYRESAFNFIHRLLEEEGIYYYFQCSDSSHTIIFCDHSSDHPMINGKFLTWHHEAEKLTSANINCWTSSASLKPNTVALKGYNMKQVALVEARKSTNVSRRITENIIYTDITPEGERANLTRFVGNRLSSVESNSFVISASVNAYWLSSGEAFTFRGHPSGDGSYIISSLSLEAENNFDDLNSKYSCYIDVFESVTNWFPSQRHEKPTISGVLTAIVVGPSSEDIHSDEYGRIKIRFPWDSENANNETSSCWVRVAQVWSGGKFGSQFIPRIGSEVLVSFIQGDPDYPLVTGTVFNGQSKLPFELPAKKNESGFVTRSLTSGTFGEGHQLSFDDTKGDERLTIIAQKDLSLTVKNNLTNAITANRSTTLQKGNDHLVLDEGNLQIDLKKGDSVFKVNGNMSNSLRNGNFTLVVDGGEGSIGTDKTLLLESRQAIEFKVGNNKIRISNSGISINGTKIDIEATTSALLKGAMVKVEGSGTAEVKGAMVKVEGSGIVEVKGAMANLSGSGMTRISGGITNIG